MMLWVAAGFWIFASVLLLTLLAVLAWFTERHPLDRVLGPIHEDESLEDELARWTA